MKNYKQDLEKNKRSDLHSSLWILIHFSFVFAPVFITATNIIEINPFFCWLWFGIFANGLINLMHEAAHRLLFRRRKSSDFFGKWILGPLLISDFEGYKKRHWVHHNKFGKKEDTKKTYLVNINKWNSLKFLIECLILKEGCKKFFSQFSSKEKKVSFSFRILFRFFLVHSIFLFLIIISNLFFSNMNFNELFISISTAYIFVYIYGLASLSVFFSTLRAIAEHQVNSLDDYKVDKIKDKGVLRNLKCNIMTKLIFGSYGFSEHATHHKFPSVPSYNLDKLTRSLIKEDSRLVAEKGYVEIICNLIFKNNSNQIEILNLKS